MSSPPKVTNLLKIHAWVLKNKGTVQTRTRNQTLRDLEADTGIKCGTSTLRQIEEEVGIKRQRGRTPTGKGKDRVRIVAIQLKKLYQSLGQAYDAELDDVVSCH